MQFCESLSLVHSKKGPKLEEPRWLSLTCGQRADLAEAQPTAHSARAEVLAKTGQRDADWRKKGLSYLVLFSGWDPLRKLRRTLARRTPSLPRGMEVPRGTGQRGAPRTWPAEGNADLAPRPCLSPSTRVFPPGSESESETPGEGGTRCGLAGREGTAPQAAGSLPSSAS